MKWIIPLQRFLAVNKKLISTIFLMIEIALLLFWASIYFVAAQHYLAWFLLIYELGHTLGEAAVILYVITLTPGIITRLQWFPTLTQPISSIILPFRRHVGILMFLTAFVHLSFVMVFPYLAQYNFQLPSALPSFMLFEWMGLLAWCCLFPMWLTSNDYSQKKLGRNWKVLHRITYIALLLIFFHLALQQTKWMWIVAPAVVLEALSWIRQWQRDAARKKIPAVTQLAQAAQPPQPASSPQNPQV